MELQLPEAEVCDYLEKQLKENGFYRGEWQGKPCWTADYAFGGMDTRGVAAGPFKAIYFFDYTYFAGKLHFEAWIRDGRTKESALTGLGAWDIKAPYSTLVLRLEKELTDRLPEGSVLKTRAMEGSKKGRLRAWQVIAGVTVVVLQILLWLMMRYG